MHKGVQGGRMNEMRPLILAWHNFCHVRYLHCCHHSNFVVYICSLDSCETRTVIVAIGFEIPVKVVKVDVDRSICVYHAHEFPAIVAKLGCCRRSEAVGWQLQAMHRHQTTAVLMPDVLG